MADISKFTKAVTATASALINQGNKNEGLSNDPYYKKMLKDTIDQSETSMSKSIVILKNNKNKNKGGRSNKKSTFLDLYSSDNGRGYFDIDGKHSSKKSNFRVLSYINDELLNDIPYKKGGPPDKTGGSLKRKQNLLGHASHNGNLSKDDDDDDDETVDEDPSLFQGFKATVIEPINSKDGSSETSVLMIDADSFNSKTPDFSIPPGLNIDELTKTDSLAQLVEGQKKLVNHLAHLEVQKKLAATEIEELDGKIIQLQKKRKRVFQKVAKIEENENYIEKIEAIVEDRIVLVKEHDGGNNDSDVKQDQIDYTEKNQQDLLNSQFKRKVQPTLQNYYSPNSLIHAFGKITDAPIKAVGFDVPFGTMCCAGINDPIVNVWDLQNHHKLGELSGHMASVTCMEMDETMVITGGRDAQIKLWNFEKLECFETLDSHVDEITALGFDGETIVSGSQDRTLRQWDIVTGKCIQTIDMNFIRTQSNKHMGASLLLAHETPVIGSLQVYDAALATGTKDGIVRLWDLRSAKVVRTLEGHTDCVTSLNFDSTSLVTGSRDKTCRISDLRTGALVDLIKFDDPVADVQLSQDKIIIGVESQHRAQVYSRGSKEIMTYSDNFDDENDTDDTPHEEKYVTSFAYKDRYLLEAYSNGHVNAIAI